MRKSRIILADTAEDYIVRIQENMVNEFYEQIDLEMITDKEYFNEFFNMPQEIDTLVISSDLYSSVLLPHNIENIFILTEEKTENAGLTSNAVYLYKYNISEIVNTIIEKDERLASLAVEKRKTKLILVDSACGGVGKTTLAMGISFNLAKRYKKVLYLNASRLHTFQYRLNNPSVISATSVYAGLVSDAENIYETVKPVIREDGFFYLPPFKAALMSFGITYDIYEKIALSAAKSKEYDFVVIDADSVFDEDKAKLMEQADNVIIVTTQTEAAVYATNILAVNMNGINRDKYIFVCNNFQTGANNALGRSNARFNVNEVIPHFDEYEKMKPVDYAKNEAIQKVAAFVM